MAGIGIGAIFLILKTRTFWRELTTYLNVIFAVILAIPLWGILDYTRIQAQVGETASANPLERVVSVPHVKNDPQHPDVYYIILDAYSSNAWWLRQNGYDNSDFTDALEERGFYIGYDSRSNYGVTIVSVPSSLNMRYIGEADREAAEQNNLSDPLYLRSLIANNQVAYNFKQMGYKYLYFLSGYLAPSLLADTNIGFFPDGVQYFSGQQFEVTGDDGSWAYRQPFLPFFLDTTFFRLFTDRFENDENDQPNPIYSPQTLLAEFEELKKIPAMDEATFTFTHIVKPHNPIQFDRDGNIIELDISDADPAKADYFFDELHFLNTRVLETIDYILAESSVPPIIILQADHGSNLGVPGLEDGWTKFEIFNAYYLPDNGAEDLYPDIAPVNSFRVVFNRYFDGDYELLEQNSFTVPNGWWYHDYFTHIPYANDDRLNLNWGNEVALIYNDKDENDDPIFNVYTTSYENSNAGERGEFLFSVTLDEISDYIGNPPSDNQLIKSGGPVAMYALTTGEFQFNIGPDAEDREWAVVVDGLPASKTYGFVVGSDRPELNTP
jgi:hypothetical protein